MDQLETAAPVPAPAPRLIGIVNITEDSFSDGGRYLAPADALAHARQLRADGAGIIELGPAASHPDATPVAAGEQRRRLLPILQQLTAESSPTQMSGKDEARAKRSDAGPVTICPALTISQRAFVIGSLSNALPCPRAQFVWAVEHPVSVSRVTLDSSSGEFCQARRVSILGRVHECLEDMHAGQYLRQHDALRCDQAGPAIEFGSASHAAREHDHAPFSLDGLPTFDREILESGHRMPDHFEPFSMSREPRQGSCRYCTHVHPCEHGIDDTNLVHLQLPSPGFFWPDRP